jgi:hypothetical protein
MRNKYVPLMMLFCIFPLAFDFKSEDGGGHAAQIALVIPVLLSGLVLALTGPRFRDASTLKSVAAFAVTLTVVGSIVPQLLHGNDLGNYMRVLLAFLLFMVGFYIGCHPWTDARLQQFRRLMFMSLTLSLIFTLAYGTASGGPIADARFKIVSPTLLGFQGFLLYDIVTKRSATRIDIIVFFITLVVELLSVTRSLLLGTILLFCVATWLASRSLPHLVKSWIRTTVIAALVALLIGGATSIFAPSVLAHWSQRLFFSETTSNGKDPTTLSRLAEIEDQFDQVTSGVENLIFGMGFGHDFRFAQRYFYDLRATGTFSEDELRNRDTWEAGHNFWVYQLFSGGIAFGVALPIAILLACFRCARKYRRASKAQHNKEHLDSLGRYLLVTAGMIASTIGGNPLGPRYGGLIYGLAFGLMVGAYCRLLRRRGDRLSHSAVSSYRRETAAPQL